MLWWYDTRKTEYGSVPKLYNGGCFLFDFDIFLSLCILLDALTDYFQIGVVNRYNGDLQIDACITALGCVPKYSNYGCYYHFDIFFIMYRSIDQIVLDFGTVNRSNEGLELVK